MLKFIWKVKGIRKAKSILNNKEIWIILLTLKIYSTATKNRLGLRSIRFQNPIKNGLSFENQSLNSPNLYNRMCPFMCILISLNIRPQLSWHWTVMNVYKTHKGSRPFNPEKTFNLPQITYVIHDKMPQAKQRSLIASLLD